MSYARDKEHSAEYQKLKSFVIKWGIIFLIVLVVLVAISVWYIANLASEMSKIADVVNQQGQIELSIKRNNLLSADYLAIVIPIIVALAGSLIAFLGMNRLKMFDERIDKIRTDMLSEIDSRVKNEVIASRAEYSDKLIEKVSEYERAISCKSKGSIAEIEKVCNDGLAKLENTMASFSARYDWLESIVEEEAGEIEISTVADAHEMVEDLRSKKPANYLSMIKKLVKKVCSDESVISGDVADYHNLSAELALANMYNEAIQVLEKGLGSEYKNVELLADLIEYATKNNQLDKAEKSVTLLNKIDRWRWNWQCYEFTIDYYRARGMIKEAKTLCSEFLEMMPYDEHGYRSMAEISMICKPGDAGIEEALKYLNAALTKHINAAQCAQKLADIYLDKGQYEESIKAASRAIQESAQDQPSVEIAHTISTRGFAFDRLFMQKLQAGTIQEDLAEKAVEDYKMAISFTQQGLGRLAPIVLKQVICRLGILSKYIPAIVEEDTPLNNTTE